MFTRLTFSSLIPLAVTTVAVACGSHHTGHAYEPRSDRKSVLMIRTPPHVLRLCRRVLGSLTDCPSLLPFASGMITALPIPSADPVKTLSIEDGLFESRTAYRPPEFLHAVLEEGKFNGTAETYTYSTTHPVHNRNGLLGSKLRRRLAARAKAIYLGIRKWGGRRGRLILVPPFENVDSIHGGHLLFSQRRGRKTFLISLHAWEPLLQATATLRCIVESMGGAAQSTSGGQGSSACPLKPGQTFR